MSDDWEEINERLDRLRRRHEDFAIADAERALSDAPTSAADEGKPPAPLEFHPFYRRHTWLLDWLDGDLFGGSHVVRVPQPPKVSIVNITSSSPDPMDLLSPDDLTLTRQRAVGFAPYVGDPFVYWWYCASDQHGRWIAGERKVKYLPEVFPRA